MKRKLEMGQKNIGLLIGSMVILMAFSAFAQDFNYIGVKKCKVCHLSKKRGAQYDQWLNSEHSKAYSHLATIEAKEVAEKAGVEGDPQKADECLSCHVLGHGLPDDRKASTFTLEEGVSCEACHGPGSGYWKMSTMKKLASGEIAGKEVGLITPTEEMCRSCHNENSPTYKEFDFEERWKEILHPVPAK